MKLTEALFYGEIVDESMRLSLVEFCNIAAVNIELVNQMMEYGIVEPISTETIYFSGVSLRRLKTALRLQNDLGINLSGVALALELLDEINDMRLQLKVHQ